MGHFNNILFVVNRSSWFRRAYDRALALAAGETACLTLLDVIEEIPHLPGNDSSKDPKGIKSVGQPAKLKKLLTARPRKAQVRLDVVGGDWLTAIVGQVRRGQHNLLILTAGPKERLPRKVMQLVRKCPCSIWIIRPDTRQRYSRIMAAVDPDLFEPIRNDLNTKIMRIAVGIARKEGSELHVTNAWSAPAEARLRSRAGFTREEVATYLSAVIKDLTRQIDVLLTKSNAKILKHRVHLVKGKATKVLPELVRKRHIDLLIVGTMSRSGVAGWLIGNTAETILQRVDCSVLILKPQRFDPPTPLKQNSVSPRQMEGAAVSTHQKKRLRAK